MKCIKNILVSKNYFFKAEMHLMHIHYVTLVDTPAEYKAISSLHKMLWLCFMLQVSFYSLKLLHLCNQFWVLCFS